MRVKIRIETATLLMIVGISVAGCSDNNSQAEYCSPDYISNKIANGSGAETVYRECDIDPFAPDLGGVDEIEGNGFDGGTANCCELVTERNGVVISRQTVCGSRCDEVNKK